MSKANEHTTMSFEILPATPNDVCEIARVLHESFSKDVPHYQHEDSDITTDELIALHTLDFTDEFSDPYIEIFKAVDKSSGAIVGFSLFEFPGNGEAARSEAEQSLRPNGHSLLAEGQISLGVPPEIIAKLRSPSYDENGDKDDDEGDSEDDDEDDSEGDDDKRWLLWEALDRCYNGDTDFFVHFLAVTPCYRRLGLGARLMQAGLKVANERRARVCLSASPMGLPVYLKLGFKVAEEINGETWMIREPDGGLEVPWSASC